jgi:hypothetical protein
MGQWYVRVQIALLAVRNVGRNEMNSSIPKRDKLISTRTSAELLLELRIQYSASQQ